MSAKTGCCYPHCGRVWPEPATPACASSCRPRSREWKPAGTVRFKPLPPLVVRMRHEAMLQLVLPHHFFEWSSWSEIDDLTFACEGELAWWRRHG